MKKEMVALDACPPMYCCVKPDKQRERRVIGGKPVCGYEMHFPEKNKVVIV